MTCILALLSFPLAMSSSHFIADRLRRALCAAASQPLRVPFRTAPLRTALWAQVLWLNACLPYSPDSNPAPPVELPDHYAQTAGGENEAALRPTGEQEGVDAAAPSRWWEAFGDPELTHLVDTAIVRNFQVRAAWARLDQAEARGMGVSANYWPQISASLDVSRRRQVIFFGALGRQEFENNNLSFSLPVSYELDLWNRVGANLAAAGLDALASRDDVEALALTVAANVVERYLDMLQQRASRRLLTAQLERNRTYLELLQLRFANGLSEAGAVYQQRQQVYAAETLLAGVEGQESVARNELAVLVGRPPGAFKEQIGSLPEASELPDPPPLPKTGLPSRLLLVRPDVRAAQRRAAAEDWRVGSAIAAQFPTLNLQASVGLSSPTLPDLLSSFVFSILSSLAAPVLDGGRLAAEVKRQKAVLQERLQSFAQTVLTAMLEVENALAQERQQRDTLDRLYAQLEAAQMNLREQRQRYGQGLSEYLPVLTALATVQNVERDLLATQRRWLGQHVQIARALGGAWTLDLKRPNLEAALSTDSGASAAREDGREDG